MVREASVEVKVSPISPKGIALPGDGAFEDQEQNVLVGFEIVINLRRYQFPAIMTQFIHGGFEVGSPGVVPQSLGDELGGDVLPFCHVRTHSTGYNNRPQRVQMRYSPRRNSRNSASVMAVRQP